MLFVCCDEAIPVESQLVLALKTLCGFEIREIALRLFASEANVYKRLGRARSRLRELPLHPGELTGEQYAATACRTQDSLPCIHRGLPLFPRRNGYPSGALRRSDTAGYDPGRTSGGSDSGNVRPVGADASARGADDRSSGQLRRVAPVGGAGARALGPAKDSDRVGVVGQVRTRRWVFSVPRGGGDRGGTLPCPLVSRDTLGQSGGVLCTLGADRTLRDTQAEPCGSASGVARTRRGTRRPHRL